MYFRAILFHVPQNVHLEDVQYFQSMIKKD